MSGKRLSAGGVFLAPESYPRLSRRVKVEQMRAEWESQLDHLRGIDPARIKYGSINPVWDCHGNMRGLLWEMAAPANRVSDP
jgi:hypothetical protein